MTGENWNSIMIDAMNLQSCILVTVTTSLAISSAINQTVYSAGTWLDPVDHRDVVRLLPDEAYSDQCSPAPAIAVIYFCTYMLIVSYLVLQVCWASAGFMSDNNNWSCMTA